MSVGFKILPMRSFYGQTVPSSHGSNCSCSYCRMNFTQLPANPAQTQNINTNNTTNNLQSSYIQPTPQQVLDYSVIQQQVIPNLPLPLNIKLEDLPPALPNKPEQIRMLSTETSNEQDNKLLTDMIPNIKELRQIATNSQGRYKLIAFENTENHDVVAILIDRQTIRADNILELIKMACEGRLTDQRTGTTYEQRGLDRELWAIRMHEFAHLLGLQSIYDIDVGDYKQGVSFILSAGADGRPEVNNLRSFGQTVYINRRMIERYNNLVAQFENIQKQTQTKPLSSQNKQILANDLTQIINQLQFLIKEEEALAVSAYAPLILKAFKNSIFADHGNPSPADKDKFFGAKQMQNQTKEFLQEALALLAQIEASMANA